MTETALAQPNDIDELVGLETRLFVEDAAVHERYADPTWPAREGHHDFTGLLANPQALVLLARDGADAVGFLVGYLGPSSPTRQPVTYAVLRSMYIVSTHRSHGIGTELAEWFIDWARRHNAAEAHVDSYAANEPAQRFYERLGFGVRSVRRVYPLTAEE